MGFREPLDISGYIDALADPTVLGGRPRIAPHVEASAREQRAREDASERQAEDFSRPLKTGIGPAFASSQTGLQLRPIWDVNGYYRMFGFAFPYHGITKAKLRVAYHELGGEDDWLLTQVLRLLVHSAYMHEYNCAPFGEPLLDTVQQQLLKRNALHEAARRTTDQGNPVDKAAVLDEWGYDFTPGEDPDDETVGGVGHDADDPSEEDSKPWPWGYYLWGSHSTDTAKLERWQALLASEFADRDAHLQFAVGYVGRRKSGSEWVTAVIGSHHAFLIREDVHPTDGHAAAAVASVLAEHTDEIVRKDRTSMSAASSKPKFGRGGAKAKEAADKAQARAPRTNYFSLKDGESAIIRLIDDGDETGWIYVKQHEYVPVQKDAPEDYQGEWPKRTGAICRHDEAFAGMYSDCWICDEMTREDTGKPYRPALRLWARAVMREAVKGTQEMVDEGKIPATKIGKRVAIKDKMIDVAEMDSKGEATGKTVEQFDVQVLNFGMKNFFGYLQGFYDVYGTVLDRDYVIKREGSGTDTEYSIVPLPEIKNGEGGIYTLEDAEVRAKYLDIVDLEEIIARRASDDHYARYFDPNKEVAKKEGAKKTSAKAKPKAAAQDDDDEADEPEPSAQKSKVDQKALAEMRARAERSRRKKSGEEEAETVDTDEESEATSEDDDELINVS